MTSTNLCATPDQIFDQCVPRQYHPETEFSTYRTPNTSNAIDLTYTESSQTPQKRYKARFKHLAPEDKQRLKNSRCLAAISVGQKIHEGEHLRAALKLINKSFESVIILICDTSQRYMAAVEKNTTADAMYQYAKTNGDLWLRRNIKLISQEITVPISILRWDEWILHPNFAEYSNTISALYENDSVYKTEIDASAEEFLLKFSNRTSIDNYARAFSLCVDHLKEECAAMLFLEKAYYRLVYPHKINRALRATGERIIQKFLPYAFEALTLKFTRLV